MKNLMTKHFSKWAAKQNISKNELHKALEEIRAAKFEANLGGHVYKKRIRFKGRGKSGSGRTIVCYKRGDKAIYVHGFAKNEKSNLSPRELVALKEFAKVLLGLTDEQVQTALQAGDFIEVKP